MCSLRLTLSWCPTTISKVVSRGSTSLDRTYPVTASCNQSNQHFSRNACRAPRHGSAPLLSAMQGEGPGPIYHRKRCVGHQNGESNWPVAPNSPAPGWCWAHWSRLWVQLLPNYALVRRRHSEDPHEYLPASGELAHNSHTCGGGVNFIRKTFILVLDVQSVQPARSCPHLRLLSRVQTTGGSPIGYINQYQAWFIPAFSLNSWSA
jgi:hypothetical protein